MTIAKNRFSLSHKELFSHGLIQDTVCPADKQHNNYNPTAIVIQLFDLFYIFLFLLPLHISRLGSFQVFLFGIFFFSHSLSVSANL